MAPVSKLGLPEPQIIGWYPKSSTLKFHKDLKTFQKMVNKAGPHLISKLAARPSAGISMPAYVSETLNSSYLGMN